MNMVTVLHKKAMEFADEALLARMEGNQQAATALFDKAFALELEAASAVPDNRQRSQSYFILLRSAASLAINCGKYQIARELIHKGLRLQPPPPFLKELQDLQEQLSNAAPQTQPTLEVVGTITYASTSKNEIRLQDIQTKELYHISVPRHLIDKIVKSFWADVVRVRAQRDASGIIVLDNIVKAA